MEEKDLKKNESQNGQTSTEELKLDDARRVKVLSPTQLVFKRFFRNKLAIVGLVIIIFMFLFSFLGGLISPYTQKQVFKGTDKILKEYATANENSDIRYIIVDGQTFPNSAIAKFVGALGKGETSFESGGNTYTYSVEGDEFYLIYGNTAVVKVLSSKVMNAYTPEEGFEVTDEFKADFEAALASGETTFTSEGAEYSYTVSGKNIVINMSAPIAVGSYYSIDAYDVANISLLETFDFRYACEKAFSNGKNEFTVDGTKYSVSKDESGNVLIQCNGEDFAYASKIFVSAKANDIQLTAEFNNVVRENILSNQTKFEYKEEKYQIELKNGNYYIKNFQESEVLRAFEAPSLQHWLGIDKNGMDILTRLMHGGRVSLLVGFIVIFIELFIGVIIGGIAGFFGGHIDNFLMRLIDLINTIPFMPIMIIFGSVMDASNVGSYTRVILMMIILGLLSWTGIARVVRGQILTLREQDFMVATEATGISIRRRIFRHLVPNVMPLLIIQATMGLGSVILTEATLSFLGLGVKYPLASWGSIINAANDIQIMTNYWYAWIPAGLLILLTVLGFNFVGDGLRDAFDPKMKR